MSIRTDDLVLAVDDPNDDVAYLIEPIRFELGLSRVEMVDWHLTDLAARGGPRKLNTGLWTDHIDALLDARATFQTEAATA